MMIESNEVISYLRAPKRHAGGLPAVTAPALTDPAATRAETIKVLVYILTKYAVDKRKMRSELFWSTE
jgi:hypothetical protein